MCVWVCAYVHAYLFHSAHIWGWLEGFTKNASWLINHIKTTLPYASPHTSLNTHTQSKQRGRSNIIYQETGRGGHVARKKNMSRQMSTWVSFSDQYSRRSNAYLICENNHHEPYHPCACVQWHEYKTKYFPSLVLQGLLWCWCYRNSWSCA